MYHASYCISAMTPIICTHLNNEYCVANENPL